MPTELYRAIAPQGGIHGVARAFPASPLALKRKCPKWQYKYRNMEIIDNGGYLAHSKLY